MKYEKKYVIAVLMACIMLFAFRALLPKGLLEFSSLSRAFGISESQAGSPASNEGLPILTRRERFESKFSLAKKAAEEAIRLQKVEAEINGTNKPVMYDLFEEGDGHLTEMAAAAASLTDLEKKIIDLLLKEAWDKASREFVAGAVFDEGKSNISEGRYVYRISIDPSRAAAAMEELEKSLSTVVGKEKQGILMKGIGDYNCFGALGKLDVRIELLASEGRVKYEYLRTGTEDCRRFGSVPISELQKKFGDSFDLRNLQN